MIKWIRETLAGADGVLSSKRHVVAAAALVLCIVTFGLGLGSTVWIWRNGDLGAGAVSALTFVCGILAGLAGSAYRKPETCHSPSQTTGLCAPSVVGAASVSQGASSVMEAK